MPATLQTRLTELLGIRYPIVLGGMAHIGSARLAAAVTKAGGLGVLGSATMEAADLDRAITEMRDQTDGPWGVNLSLVVKQCEDEVAVVLERGVEVVVVSGGSPKRLTERLRSGGCTVLHVVPNVTLAQKAQDAGVHAVVLEGAEAGGHLGHDELPLSVMLPLARETLDVPVVAAGGVICGRGLAAALILGADGVQLGTRFAASAESPAHARYKQLVVDAGEGNPVVYGRLEHPARGLNTPAVERVRHLDRSGASPEEIDRARGLGRARLALLDGDEQEGIFPCGLGAARIQNVRPVGEIVDRMIEEYRGVLEELPRE